MLFFKCMSALFNPIYRRGEGINWGLVSFTVVMFSLATVCTTMNLDINSISYIDNREYPGGGGTAPGPLGYIATVFYKAINIVPNTAFVLNNWLADGLLVRFFVRCCIPSPRRLTPAPLALSLLRGLLHESLGYCLSLLHVPSICGYVSEFYTGDGPLKSYIDIAATGILMVYPIGIRADGSVWSILPYFSISLSLNVILTLMIVVRLILHNKEVGATTELPAGKNGLYKTVVTMLVESSALYAVSSLLVIGPLAAGSPAMDMFSPVLALTQVRVLPATPAFSRVAQCDDGFDRSSLHC